MSRFAVTFLGHQGWMFEARSSRVLVDPLLVEEFGHGGAVGCVYPPRVVSISDAPIVDAVFFTHEHEDHFNLPSVHRLSRQIPIHVPRRSSDAMPAVLREMGFAVRFLEPDRPVLVGDLELRFFSPDHLVTGSSSDEWETMPFLVRDVAEAGSFFSSVDVLTYEALERRLRALMPKPGLWCYTNNAGSATFEDGGPPLRAIDLAVPFIQRHARLFARWGPPAASLICGGGMSFGDERAWINRNFFPLDSQALFQALGALCPEEQFIVPEPGQTVVMASGRIVDLDHSQWIRVRPREQWPDRRFAGDVSFMTSYAPATSMAELTDGDSQELREHLDELAAFLYRGVLFRALHSLSEEEVGKRRPAYALLLRSGDDGWAAVAYDTRTCAFVPIPDSANPVEEYIAGMECYASDLLQLLRGRLTASALLIGHARFWNQNVTRRMPQLAHELWMYTHPLRRPDRALRFYRALLAAEPRDVPQVGAALADAG